MSKIKKFSKLPKQAKEYIKAIEKIAGVKVTFIGTGPERQDVIIN